MNVSMHDDGSAWEDDDSVPTPSTGQDSAEIEHDGVIVYRSHLPSRPFRSRPVQPSSWPRSKERSLFQFSISGNLHGFNRNRRRKAHHDTESDSPTAEDKAWLSSKVLGGMRGDPFNALPVEPRDCIPLALDQLVQCFIPERILRPFQAVPGMGQLTHDYFQLVIHDVCVFEATIAQVQANYVAQQGIRTPTKEVLHHHGKALIHLQDKLADPVKRIEDATFQAIIAIMGTHFFFGELDAHQAHLDGLWNLIRMRGGIDTLGWNGTLKQAIETMTSYRTYLAKVETPENSPASSPEAASFAVSTQSLDYPKHPFSWALSETIARLPSGFGEIALKRQLSVQVIDLLADVHEQTITQGDQSTVVSASSIPAAKRHLYPADKCVQLLKSHNMPELERNICGGLLAYTIQSQPAESRTTIYDECLMTQLADLARYVYLNYTQESLLWVTFCFASLQQHLIPSRPEFFHHTILRFKQSAKWERVEAALKNYLWTEERLVDWRWCWEDTLGRHRPDGRGVSRTPSRTPELVGGSWSGSGTRSGSKDLTPEGEVKMEEG